MNNIDINKIVDDAMEKKDRQVHIFIVSDTVSVNVTPLADSDPRWIICEVKRPGSRFPKREFECSECHVRSDCLMSYCGHCGEKLRMPIEEDLKKKDMAKFEIWFGKDPEELEFDCSWPDVAVNSDTFREKYVADMFRTDDVTDFWNKFIDIHVNPNAMWYWVIIDGKTTISGAIDPDDIYGPDVPAWVRTTIENRRKDGTDK